ncbi:MAG: hypothetical protein KF862_10925 [Chitinophagaceae bacterium]|nr:hypothetical protein [Chitinophagaceae bacterium]
MEEAISTFGYTPYIQDPQRGLIVFAISIKVRHTFTQPPAVIGIPPASKPTLEQCYGGSLSAGAGSNPRVYASFKLLHPPQYTFNSMQPAGGFAVRECLCFTTSAKKVADAFYYETFFYCVTK